MVQFAASAMTSRNSSHPCLEHHWVITGTGDHIVVTMQHGIASSVQPRISIMAVGFYGAERAQVKQEVLAAGAEYPGAH